MAVGPVRVPARENPLNLVLNRSDELAAWVARRIPHVDSFGQCAAIGVERGGECVGAVVYHEYRGNDIQLSCAATSPRWLSRAALRSIFAYPFIQLQVDRVTAFTPARARATRQFLESTGFIQEGIMRRGFDDDDCVVYGMLREECKWIEQGENHG